VQAVRRVETRSDGQAPYTRPMLGGSRPLYHFFVERLGTTVMTVPTVNADNSRTPPTKTCASAACGTASPGWPSSWPCSAPSGRRAP